MFSAHEEINQSRLMAKPLSCATEEFHFFKVNEFSALNSLFLKLHEILIALSFHFKDLKS